MSDSHEYWIDDRPATREEVDAMVAAAHRGEYGVRLVEVLHPDAKFLEGQDRDYTSQFGEDGLLAAVFQKIGVKNRWCFEVGAGDGVTLSNTKVLRDLSWQALLIEADWELFRRLEASSRRNAWAYCYYRRIGTDDLDELLKDCGAPKDLDLGVIDIDGQDYHVWEGMKVYRPRVMMVEYNQQDAEVPPLGGTGQAGLTAILKLGRQKGYLPLVRTNVNVIFVAQEEWK